MSLQHSYVHTYIAVDVSAWMLKKKKNLNTLNANIELSKVGISFNVLQMLQKSKHP